jgi:hypothetical protein
MASTAPVRAIDIAALTQFLNSLQSYSSDLIQHLQSGQTLCHYTTLDGAYGIITGRDLWLTSVLAELEAEAKGNQPRLDWLLELRTQLSAAREDEVYICCFCERENLLRQWRGYADDGGGVSMEFDAQGFGPIRALCPSRVLERDAVCWRPTSACANYRRPAALAADCRCHCSAFWSAPAPTRRSMSTVQACCLRSTATPG